MINSDIIKALIIILIYLIATTNHTKESLMIYPSDISLSYYEYRPTNNNCKSDLIISKYNIINSNYFKHTNNYIYLHNIHKSFYNYNYRYNNNLYHNDFKFKYVGIFIIKQLDNYSREWIRNNLKSNPFLYKIIYIYDDKINKYNKKLFPYIEYGCTVVIYGIKPYYRYTVDRCVILSNRELSFKCDFQCNTTRGSLKFYFDKNNLICILKNNKKILDKFVLNSNIEEAMDKFSKNKKYEHYQITIGEKLPEVKWKWDGIPDIYKINNKWYDSVFDDWNDFILTRVKDSLNKKKINIKTLSLPSHYMHALYLYHRNVKEAKQENIINQIIQDMQLPMKNIKK